ncbi:MAG: hypothetical protein ACTH6N_00435 [Brachybacterium tyrofermentans]|uniref:hypothetical protein n=1 Tax=Brachybacterium TaxID=43668 RepID=UPI001865E044|nr:hypothetical protein [Brachybacterium tyrofermentans]
MKESKSAPTGRTLPLGWTRPEGEPAALRGPGTGEIPATGTGGGTGRVSAADPGSGRRTRRRGVALAGAICAVLVLVLVLPRLLIGGASPEDPVRAFLDALVAGDVATVREHLADSAETSDIALTEEVLRAATDRITSYTIDAVETGGGQATVTASLSSGTSVEQASFTVRSQATSSFAPATWELVPVVATEFVVTVPEGVRELLINAVPIPLSGQPSREGMYGQQLLILRLLPGSYELGLPARSERLFPVVEKVSIPMQREQLRRAGAVLGYELSTQGFEEVTAQVEATLEKCAAATVAAPPECPFFAFTDDRPDGPVGSAGVMDAEEPSAVPGTWQVTSPSSYQIDRWISASWNITSDTGYAVFTSAPGADGSAGTSQIVPFVIDGIVVLDPSGELHIALSQGLLLNIVTCIDVDDGSRETVTWPLEGESVAVCQDGE